jgi:hypothetical protein
MTVYCTWCWLVAGFGKTDNNRQHLSLLPPIFSYTFLGVPPTLRPLSVSIIYVTQGKSPALSQTLRLVFCTGIGVVREGRDVFPSADLPSSTSAGVQVHVCARSTLVCILPAAMHTRSLSMHAHRLRLLVNCGRANDMRGGQKVCAWLIFSSLDASSHINI